MYTCGVCHFQVEMDDVSLPGPNGHCVCLGCYLRETDQWQAMPKALRNELTAVHRSPSSTRSGRSISGRADSDQEVSQ
jgi:hypothetical protein